MSIQVTHTGLSDTIQDLGRFGYAHFGINPGGAMDKPAAQVANFLTGNAKNEAVIEMHFPAARFLIEEPCLLAVTGADFGMYINDVPVNINTPVKVSQGSVIDFRKNTTGARAYLAVHGGFNIQPWLNSFSTNLKAKAGGYEGRALKKGDRLLFKKQTAIDTNIPPSFKTFSWQAAVSAFYADPHTIRITAGNELPLLSTCSTSIFTESSFTISMQSDRMGYRMQGVPLILQNPLEMISSAVTEGTIQLLPSGQLIILMADHQTTGGYPRLAHVITADISKLAQQKPGTRLTFKLISQSTAETLLFQQQQHLQQLQNALTFKNNELFSA